MGELLKRDHLFSDLWVKGFMFPGDNKNNPFRGDEKRIRNL
jgi:hypothetical protein